MKLKITEIDRGNLEKERIVMKATGDTDAGRYLVVKTRKFDAGHVSSKVSEALWLQDKEVKKDDWVVVYTKSGSYKSTVDAKGVTTHFFYWDKTNNLWDDLEEIPTLLSLDEWKSFFG